MWAGSVIKPALVCFCLGGSTIQAIDIPTDHFIDEGFGHHGTFNSRSLKRVQRVAAIELRLALKVHVVERHVFSEQRFQPVWRVSDKTLGRDKIQSFGTEKPADRRQPHTVRRGHRVCELIGLAGA